MKIFTKVLDDKMQMINFAFSILIENILLYNMNIELKYEYIFKQHYANLVFFASRFISNEEAEDVVQSVFVDLWEKKKKIDFDKNIQSFLYHAVYSRSMNVLRHQKVVDNYSQDQIEIDELRIKYYSHNQNDIIRRLENEELHIEMNQIINKLPTKSKEVFLLSYVHNMKNKEIAELLEISERTVESHLYKSLKVLRVAMKHLLFVLLTILSK